jgi:hypothetical protein
MAQLEQLQVPAATLAGASASHRTRLQWHPPLWTTTRSDSELMFVVED